MPKLLQINITANWGSTGKIAETIGVSAMAHGRESYIAYGPLEQSFTVAPNQDRRTLFIPLYDEVYQSVLQRYHDDFRKEGEHSYDYKIHCGRVSNPK